MHFFALFLAAALLAGCAPGGGSSAGGAQPGQSGSASDGREAAEPPGGPQVQADWSVLEGREPRLHPDADGGRWYPDYTGHLIPGEDYGDLVPYLGAVTYRLEHRVDAGGREYFEQSTLPNGLYGLMTREGKIVVDPVYQEAAQVEYRQEGESRPLPVLVLRQSREEWAGWYNGGRCALAGLDGSWCTGFEFWAYTARAGELLLVGPAGLTRLDSSGGGRRDWSWASLGLSQEMLPQVLKEVMWLYGFSWTQAGVFLGSLQGEGQEIGQIRVFSPDTGRVSYLSREAWEDNLDRWYAQRYPTPLSWDLSGEGAEVTLSREGTQHTLALPKRTEVQSYEIAGDLAILFGYDGLSYEAWLYRLSTGELLLEGPEILFLSDPCYPEQGPYIRVRDGAGQVTLYTPEPEALLTFTPSRTGGWVYTSLHNGILRSWEEGVFSACHDIKTGRCIFYRNLTLGD